jgi:hypothetical protein
MAGPLALAGSWRQATALVIMSSSIGVIASCRTLEPLPA